MTSYMHTVMSPAVLTPVLTQDKVRMCYFTNWAQRRQDIQYRFTPDNLDPFISTHVLYAFAHISADRTTVKTTDPFDEGEDFTRKT